MIKTNYREILRIALPAMAENVLQLSMGLVDSYLIASLGVVALSGVSVSQTILTVYQALFIALVTAISSRLSYFLGKKEMEKLEDGIVGSMTLTVMVGVFLGCVTVLGGSSLLGLLGVEEEVRQVGVLYLSIVGGGIVCLGLMSTLSAIVRVFGRTTRLFWIVLVVNLLNVLLSALAVLVFQTGIIGVAMATVVSRLLGCVMLWRQVPLSIPKRMGKLDRDLLALALPAAAERLMMRVGDVVMLSFIVGLGTTAVAGNAVGENVIQLTYLSALGISTATVILTGKQRQEPEKVAKIFRDSLVLSLVLMFLVSAFIYFFGTFLLGLYTQDSQVLAAGQLVLLYSMLGVPFTASTLILTALWQGMGNTKLPFYATAMGMCFIRIGLGYVLISCFHLGLHAIWLGTLADNFFRAIFLYTRYKKKARNAFGSASNM